MDARCSLAATVSSPVAVSLSRTSTPVPGRPGTCAPRHESIDARLQLSCRTIVYAWLLSHYFDRKYRILTDPEQCRASAGRGTAKHGIVRPKCFDLLS